MKKIELNEWEEVRGRLDKVEKVDGMIKVYLDKSYKVVLEYPLSRVYEDILENLEGNEGEKVGILQTDNVE